MKTKPTEALKIIDENWDKGGTLNDLKIGDIIACNVAFKEGQSNPKIKQLEWRENHFDIIADTLYGKYIVSKPVLEVAYIVYLNNSVIEAFFNLDEAKDFVQKDFEARIKECLIIE